MRHQTGDSIVSRKVQRNFGRHQALLRGLGSDWFPKFLHPLLVRLSASFLLSPKACLMVGIHHSNFNEPGAMMGRPCYLNVPTDPCSHDTQQCLGLWCQDNITPSVMSSFPKCHCCWDCNLVKLWMFQIVPRLTKRPTFQLMQNSILSCGDCWNILENMEIIILWTVP